jgi:molybdopterin molybdotransferase
VEQGFFRVVSRAGFLDLLRRFPAVDAQRLPISRAFGRVLAEDVAAPEDLPLADRSCMDGFAVRAADLFGAGEGSPVQLARVADVAVEAFPEFTLAPGQCAWIPTGGCLPAGADAVIMVEFSEALAAGTVEMRKAVAPGENVMRRGEDAKSGEPALRAGTRLRAQEIGLLAALGVTEAAVSARPRAVILSTGDEVRPVEARIGPGQVRDVNSHALSCLIEEAGGEPKARGIVADELDALVAAIKAALAESDLVLLSGGSSVGVRDLTMQALGRFPDSEVLAHGVAMSPGKPTILARVGGKPFLGLPGQIASAQVVMLVLGRPLVRHLCGDRAAFDELLRPMRRAELSRNLASKHGREDYVRVRLESRPGRPPLAVPVLGKSGLLRTLLDCQGLIAVPADLEGLYAGSEVDVWLI